MTVTIDLDTLQAAAGIRVPLLADQHVHRSVVTGEAVAGFDGIRGAELVADVLELRGVSSPQVTVAVQQSPNGSGWTTVHSFVFTNSGSQSFTVDAPDDQFRVVCTPAGGIRDAVVSVFCVPKFVDPTGGGGGGISEVTSDDETVVVTNGTGPTVDLSVTSGGSVPGTPQITGPYSVDFTDFDPDPTVRLELFVPVVGSLVTRIFIDPATAVAFDGDDTQHGIGQTLEFDGPAPLNGWLGGGAGFNASQIPGLKIPITQVIDDDVFGEGFPVHIANTDPVLYGIDPAGATVPSQGHFDLYFEVVTPVAP